MALVAIFFALPIWCAILESLMPWQPGRNILRNALHVGRAICVGGSLSTERSPDDPNVHDQIFQLKYIAPSNPSTVYHVFRVKSGAKLEYYLKIQNDVIGDWIALAVQLLVGATIIYLLQRWRTTLKPVKQAAADQNPSGLDC